MTRSTDVSVIVPNLHSPTVGRTLDSLRCQDYPRLVEVIVVGQDQYGQVEHDELIRFIETSKPVPPAVARNQGIRAARGQVVAFIDADCEAAPDWLSALLAHYDRPSTAVVGGAVDFPSDNYWTLCDNLATFYEFLPHTPRGRRDLLPSLNLAVSQAALSEVGLFDERYPYAAGEDADLTTRLRLRGYELWFEPLAIVTHRPQRRSWRPLFRHAYNFGRYSVKIDPRYRPVRGSSKLMKSWWEVLIFSPLLAAGVTGKALFSGRLQPRHWRALPVFYALKVAWCLGAASTLRGKHPFLAS